MKTIKLYLLICMTFFIFVGNTYADQPNIALYKNLYYGMPKNEVTRLYNTEPDPEDQNQLISYNQDFIGYQWNMVLTFNNNSKLESVYLETDLDDNANKLTSLMAALGKNFSAVYGVHDSSNVDFVSILKTKGASAYQQAIGDFFMEAVSNSSSINIISISNDAMPKSGPKANNYMSLLQQIPDTARQAELIIQSYEDDSVTLAVDFTLPKMQIMNIQNQKHEDF